jgi:hypothetical protein
MARFSSYEPGPTPDSFMFHDEETGKPLLAMGPEAQALKAKIDAETANLKVAGPGGGNPETFGEDTEAAQTQPVSATRTFDADTGRFEGEPAPKTPVAVPWRSVKGGTVERIVDPETGQVLGHRVRTSGSPGISKEQLKKKAEGGVALPSGMRTTVEGGYKPDEQYLEQLYNTSIDRKLAAQAAADAEREAHEAERKLAIETATIRDIEAQEQAAKNDEITKRVENERLSYDSAVEAVRGKKVDSKRLFRGAGGTLRLVALAIANGFGQYAATMTGTRNTTWDIINGAIDRDIAEQEHEIMQGNKNVDNALARLTRSTGNLEQGKLLLRQLQKEHALAEMQDVAARAKSKEVDAKLDRMMTDEDMAREATREEYLRLAAGKHASAVEARFAYPQAGSGGGIRSLTFEEADQILKGEETSLGFRKTEADIRKTEAEAAKAGREAEGRGMGLSAKDRGAMAAARQSLNNTLSQLGLSYDPKTNKVATTIKGADIPGIGLLDEQQAKLPGTKHSYARQTVVRQLIQQIFEASGLTVTEQEYARHEKSLFGDGTERGFLNGLNNVIREAKAKEKAVFQGKDDQIPEVGEDTELPEPEEVTR